MRVYESVCVGVCVRAYAHLCVCADAYVCAHMCVCVCVCARVCVLCKHVCMNDLV